MLFRTSEICITVIWIHFVYVCIEWSTSDTRIEQHLEMNVLNILAVFLYTQFNYFISLVRVNINEDVIYRFGWLCVHFEYLILFLKVCVLSVTVSVETRACEPYRESLLNSLFLLFGWKLLKVTHVYIQSLLGKFDTVMCWCCNVLSFCYMHMLL